MIYDRWYARAYASADNYHTRKTPTVALSLTVIEVAKFCVAKNKRDIRFLYFCRTRRFAHIGLRSDMRGKVTNIIRDYLHFPHKKRKGRNALVLARGNKTSRHCHKKLSRSRAKSRASGQINRLSGTFGFAIFPPKLKNTESVAKLRFCEIFRP